MKKVVHINLGGKEFTIDEDAYAELDHYLKSIEKHFSKSKGFEGILYDIEVRIGELLEEDTQHGTIVNMAKINRIMNTMGRPKDFTDEHSADASSDKKKKKINIKTGKKLYRDTENQMFSGVAAGLSAYFGIKDPLLIRILFVVFALSGGIGIIAYFVMWVAIPKAETSSDYLAMQGEEINIDNIAKTVESGITTIKDKIQDISKGIKTRML
ncbi:MAG: PspC domain-containing protein [Saprospiraceae bacterium]|nr:PspC domain-containing protein [Bacteroidia bacterium]NNE13707.1 PspC domain-containing protein [Saprospiraceae bacterium]NNL90978.1 PspC domain-containing protein [Saprospiraceae bacterium]